MQPFKPATIAAAALGLVLCTAPDDAAADGLTLPCTPRLLAGGWSHHADRGAGYNEDHDMLGLACGPWSAMRFTNSLGREAYGAGYEWLPGHWKPAPALDLHLGVYGGVWTGYPAWKGGMPVGAARARLTVLDRFAVSASSAGVIHTLHLEFFLH